MIDLTAWCLFGLALLLSGALYYCWMREQRARQSTERLLVTLGKLARDVDRPLLMERAPGWTKLRDEYVRDNPTCACCGAQHDLDAHHVRPAHLWPELELDRDNLMTLCRRCHLLLGHLDDWRSYNPHCCEDVVTLRGRMALRPYGRYGRDYDYSITALDKMT